MRQRISSGSRFEEAAAYSRAVVVDGWVFVAGTTGTDYATGTVPAGVETQCRLALENVKAALAEAGAGFDDVVRVRYIVADRAEFEPCLPLLRAAFETARPAATLIEAGLIDAAMRIEIEVTARLPAAG